MGKGEGKGGCGVFDAIGDCIQCIAATICCLLVAGPILIIIGIVFISSAFTNDRAQRIDEFKVAVQNWDNGNINGFASTTDSDWQYSLVNSCGNSLTAKALARSSAPEDLGNESEEREDFASYERVSFVDESPGVASQTTNDQQTSCTLDISITFKDTPVGNISTPVVEVTQMSFSSLGCQTTTRSDSNRNPEQRDVQSCRERCTSRGGQPSGSDYGSFQCKMSLKPKRVCVRVAKSGESWAVATGTLPDRAGGASGSGCFLAASFGTPLNWEAVEKEAASSGQLNVPVQVRSEHDPYLYFLDISDGRKDFGLTTGEKLQIGFTLLIIGAIIQALVCCACCMIVKFARGIASGNTQRPENPVGGALYDVSAKYGNYVPGGAAIGHPVAQGVPAQGVPANQSPGAYDGTASYDTPGNYNNAQQSSPYGGGGYSPYGGGQYAPSGGQAGAPPPGYPSAV